MDARRMLVYRFLELPHVTRMEIVDSLGLTEESDSLLPEKERDALCFQRASHKGIVADLWDAVAKEYSNMKPNPFRIKDFRQDPESLRLQAEATEAQKKLEVILKEVQEKFPALEGSVWAITSLGKLEQK